MGERFSRLIKDHSRTEIISWPFNQIPIYPFPIYAVSDLFAEYLKWLPIEMKYGNINLIQQRKCFQNHINKCRQSGFKEKSFDNKNYYHIGIHLAIEKLDVLYVLYLHICYTACSRNATHQW